jgi:hypothetical protein
MKKIFPALVLISLGLLVFVPVQAATTEGVLTGCTLTVEAAKVGDCAALNTRCDFDDNPDCGICCFLQTLYKVTDWFFVILIALAGIFVIMGSMNLLMSGGDPSKVASGRQYVIYAIIGLIVGFLARAIPAIVKLAVGA